MKNESLYNKTVNILVQAYFNDTLRQSNCHACAVGNIVAANMGYTFERSHVRWNEDIPDWFSVFITCSGKQTIRPKNYFGKTKRQIDSTGYSWMELAQIEKAFEASNLIVCGDKMFNGLMAVIDVLDKIHDNTDTAETIVTKRKFNKSISNPIPVDVEVV